MPDEETKQRQIEERAQRARKRAAPAERVEPSRRTRQRRTNRRSEDEGIAPTAGGRLGSDQGGTANRNENAEIVRLTARIGELEEQVEQHGNENARLTAKIADLEGQAEQHRNEVVRLTVRVAELERLPEQARGVPERGNDRHNQAPQAVANSSRQGGSSNQVENANAGSSRDEARGRPLSRRNDDLPVSGQLSKFKPDGTPLDRKYWSDEITPLDKNKVKQAGMDYKYMYKKGAGWDFDRKENILKPGADRRPFAHFLPSDIPVSRSPSPVPEPVTYHEKVYYVIPENNWSEAEKYGAKGKDVRDMNLGDSNFVKANKLKNMRRIYCVEGIEHNGQPLDRNKFKHYSQVNIDTGDVLRPGVHPSPADAIDHRLTWRGRGGR